VNSTKFFFEVKRRNFLHQETLFVFRLIRTIVRPYWITLFNFTAR